MKYLLKKFHFQLLFLIFLILPTLSFAETGLSAGFAPSSVWISRSSVTAGDSVNIFTVIYNSSEEGVSGDLIFLVDEKSIGVKHFTLTSGETQAQSLPWITSSGQHTISAKIENSLSTKTNTNQNLASKATGSITVTVKPAPPPPPPTPPSQTTQVLNTVVSGVQTGIASSVPVVSSVFQSIYNTTESLRTQAEKALAKQVENKSKTNPTKNSSSTDSASGAISEDSNLEPIKSNGFIPTTQKYLAGVMFTVVSSKLLFYLALILSIILIFLMLRMVWRERKRKHSGY